MVGGGRFIYSAELNISQGAWDLSVNLSLGLSLGLDLDPGFGLFRISDMGPRNG